MTLTRALLVILVSLAMPGISRAAVIGQATSITNVVDVSLGSAVRFIGSGAIGSYAAGHLARDGNDVSLVCLGRATVDNIRSNGLHLWSAPGGELNFPPIKGAYPRSDRSRS